MTPDKNLGPERDSNFKLQINRIHVKNLLFIDKNYNATIFDITIHASKDSVDIKLFKERLLTNTGALIGFKVQHKA